ncbi:MAG: Gfo/Idh/MocA family oxidoreductase [Melioribacteraceae bacterium]|nr:Gfo/Idh/MocA family oxidoreductase [Melioribacteraceae bacterium]
MIKPAIKFNINPKIPKRIKWGIAGDNDNVEENFILALNKVQLGKVTSLYSHNLTMVKKLAEKNSIPNYTNSYDQFLDSGIDIIYFANTKSENLEMIKKAATKGINILCESPIAPNIQEAEEITEVCAKQKVNLFVNQAHRLHPLLIKAKELIESNFLGKIISISVSLNSNVSKNESDDSSKNGIINELGFQAVDILRYFGGEILEIKGYIDNFIHHSTFEDYSTAIVKFNKIGYGIFSISAFAKQRINRIEISGVLGTLLIESNLGKKMNSSRLIIDIHKEGKMVFRKRANKIAPMIRSIHKTLSKNLAPFTSGEESLKNLLIIEQLKKNS